MSGRCKSCNEVLDEFEMKTKWPGSNEFCDLCTDCLSLSSDGDDDFVELEPLLENWEYSHE